MQNLQKNICTQAVVLWLFIICVLVVSCQSPIKEVIQDDKAKLTLDKLLESLENKDIAALKETMSSSGKMELVLANGEILSGVDAFVDFHKAWFQDTSWTIRHELVDFQSYEHAATATVRAYYNEPDRNGKPYYHNMVVSYVLRKSDDGQWSVIKDQATSFDKSN